jgi:hypothetical protein
VGFGEYGDKQSDKGKAVFQGSSCNLELFTSIKAVSLTVTESVIFYDNEHTI